MTDSMSEFLLFSVQTSGFLGIIVSDEEYQFLMTCKQKQIEETSGTGGTGRTVDLSSEERRNRKEHIILLDIYQLKP